MIQPLGTIESAPHNNKDGQTTRMAHPDAVFRWLVLAIWALAGMVAIAEQAPTPTPTPHKSRLKSVIRSHRTTRAAAHPTPPVQHLLPGRSPSRTTQSATTKGSTKRLARKAARPVPTPDEPATIDGVYRGKLGNDDIVLEIGESPDNGLLLGNPAKTDVMFPVMGRYFRRSVGTATLLVGKRTSDGSIVLREYRGRSRASLPGVKPTATPTPADASRSDADTTAGAPSLVTDTGAKSAGVVEMPREREPGALRVDEGIYIRPAGGMWRLTFKSGVASGVYCECDLMQIGATAGGEKAGGQATASATVPAGEQLTAAQAAAMQAGMPQTGAQTAISVTRVDTAIDSSFGDIEAGNERLDPAYYNLLLDFPLQEGHEVTVSDKMAYVIEGDPRFQVSEPKITRFPDANIMRRINEEFADHLKRARLKAAQFRQGDNFEGGDWARTESITCMSSDILNLLSVTEWSLAAMIHAEGSRDIFTYDMHTGDTFDFAELFENEMDRDRLKGLLSPAAVTDGGASVAAQTTEAQAQVGQKTGRPAQITADGSADDPIDSALIELYLRHFERPSGSPAGCHNVVGPDARERMLVEVGPVWPDSRGLAIGMSMNLSHAEQECGPDAIVPYDEVLLLLRDDSTLKGLIAGVTASGKK